MTPAEAARVLAAAGTFDGRHNPPSPEDARIRANGWSLALADSMPAPWAIDAVVAHYARTTDYLMPAHLNAAWRAHRADQRNAEQLAELQSVDRVPMPAEVRAQLDQVLDRTAIG